ncbi:gamma-butyrobetaine hydroxylase-like domain-containing protein [Thiolapillus sp.]|uniref:gamma-butyrobetaine hydroxylase-like domain-containing protein n=1 Tax=Thiolapillus sp. TaxID=2017437 RepID=UPI003AF4260C
MSHPTPTELNLHRVSRVLEVSFDDGSNFKLPAEYLRTFSPSAEVMGHGPGQRKVPTGIEKVNIDQIEPVGNYAIVLHFDDEHNTGIYSWETLYNLGKNYDRYWQQYLDELKEVGYTRQDPAS